MKFLNTNKYGNINIVDLESFEKTNQLRLPEDYRSFLIEFNGGVPENNIITIDSFRADVRIIFGMHDGPYYANFWEHLDMFQNRIPSWYIPIAGDSGGNLFLMSLWEGNKGIIGFWEHETEAPEGQADQYFDNMFKIADTFTDFINKLTNE